MCRINLRFSIAKDEGDFVQKRQLEFKYGSLDHTDLGSRILIETF